MKLPPDTIVSLPQGNMPDYRRNNSTLSLMHQIEKVQLAAEREYYRVQSLQYLFPFEQLSFYPPSDGQARPPEDQDNKLDSQKQSIADFVLGDMRLVRGLCVADEWSGPSLRVSYRGGPDSRLARSYGKGLGAAIRLRIKIGLMGETATLEVPYNERTRDYEVEIWGYDGKGALADRLQDRGRAAVLRGEIVARPDLIFGHPDEFSTEKLQGLDVREVGVSSALHPVLPLPVEMTWFSTDGTATDAHDGAPYRYEFAMLMRGWNAYLSVGQSSRAHGGFGGLEYRNLFSNYGRFAGELGRTLPSWSFDAFGNKPPARPLENFFALDYIDVHLMKPKSAIGLHRHRDNQEVFLLLNGRAFMVVGDWAELPTRQRAFEIRSLEAGHLALLKGGNLHALINPSDEDASLLTFGGYD